jgi:hypothetical protein
MGATDIVHAVMFVATVGAYLALNLMGHADPSNSEALLGLASFIGGSYARGIMPAPKQ